MNTTILVGSQALFSGIDGFISKDHDYLELQSEPKDYKNVRQYHFKDKCVFQWRLMPPEEFISLTLQRNCPMEIGKFLVPEAATAIGLTIDDLKRLTPLAEALDDKHRYEAVILKAYIENGAFTLTDEQLNEAYKEYIKYR